MTDGKDYEAILDKLSALPEGTAPTDHSFACARTILAAFGNRVDFNVTTDEERHIVLEAWHTSKAGGKRKISICCIAMAFDIILVEGPDMAKDMTQISGYLIGGGYTIERAIKWLKGEGDINDTGWD